MNTASRRSIRFALAAAVATLLTITAACSNASDNNSSPGGSDVVKVGFIGYDGNAFFAGQRKGVKVAAKAAGIKMEFLDGSSAGDPAKEQLLIRQYITAKVDVILISATPSAANALSRAKAAGIKVVCYNSCVDNPEKYVDAFVVGDPVEYGHTAGLFLADYFTKLGNKSPKVAVLNCEFAPICVDRRKGFEQAMKEKGFGNVIVTNQAGVPINKALTTAKNILTAKPDLDAFWSETGPAAEAALAAIKSANKEGKVVAFSSDMSTVLATALVDNTILKSTVDVSGVSQGSQALNTALAIFKSGKAASPFVVPSEIKLYSTPEQGKQWLEAHADGLP
jgi:ABC-type sugar transport system substrate-binding protein